jgi:hypothetical protein
LGEEASRGSIDRGATGWQLDLRDEVLAEDRRVRDGQSASAGRRAGTGTRVLEHDDRRRDSDHHGCRHADPHQERRSPATLRGSTSSDRIRKSVGNGSCWIVVEEPGRLTLSLIQKGMWVAIRTRRADKSWRNALPEMLERESAFLGLSSPITRVIVCAQGEFNTEMYDAWRTEALAYGTLALAAE